MKRLRWTLAIPCAIFLLRPAVALGDAVTILDCGTGPSYVAGDGQPRTCSETLSGGGGSATIDGYVDGGSLYFGSYLSIAATNYVPPVPPGYWWNILAQAGWEDTITVLNDGAPFVGSLEMTYSVSGTVHGNFPIRGVLYMKGQPLSNGTTADTYWYLWGGTYTAVSYTKIIPFVFGTPQGYGAWLRSDLLMQGQTLTGAAYADFAHTAALTMVRVLDENGRDMTAQVRMVTASGDANPFGLGGGTPIPEPTPLLLLGPGLVCLRLRLSSRTRECRSARGRE